MNYDEAIKSLQDTAVVMAEIQRRQSEIQKLQAAEIDALRERVFQHDKWSARIEEVILEMGDKLNGLIGYVDRLPKRPPGSEREPSI